MRARARWGVMPLLAAPAGAWALGLGDIELQSALNQPFRAEIALAASADELQGLRILLASPDTFERYGLDRPGFLNNFEFRVVAVNGRNVIQVVSRESVAEPFVTLLLEATWPRGRMLREYTVLLDPPVLLPAPAAPPAVRPAETRSSGGNTSGGAISRPAAPPAAEPSAPAPAPAVREPNVSSATPPPASRAPVSAAGGSYGPVQRAETLWAIADRLRPDDVTVNQMMIAIYQANPAAFGGNINVLRAGVTLRLPESADFASLAATVANAEVRRQTDEWQNRTPGGQLRLLPPAETEVARAPAPAPAAPAPRPAATPPPASDRAAADAAAAASAEESRRLLEVRNAELQRLQQAADAQSQNAPPPAPESAAPGVDLERDEQLFADEEPAPAPAAEAPPAPAPAPVVRAPVASEPSLVSRAVGWLLSPVLWIGLGVAALLLTALWFVRRRRQETEDVTGRWEALESETDEDQETRDATERLRRQLPEETIVVEEQHAEPRRAHAEPEVPSRRSAAPRPQRAAASADETLSSQTVINLDQADAVAEADFHIAYGLYDQAAELVQKALEAAPDRRDLKLKLLEVYFMWGNKDAFLKAAQALRSDVGQADDPDWNKVVIMGRQICPDERLFTEATTGTGRVDVDLEAGDSPLDLAFDDAASADVAAAADAGLDLNLESSDVRPAPKPAKPARAAARDFGGDALDIGARTAAGLEAALFEDLAQDQDDKGSQTTPDLAADSLAVTQESPTIERPGSSDWATVESPTAEFASEAPTVETPTIESPAARSAATTASRTLAIPRRSDPPTVEQPALSSASSDYTAEIDLDDLGLDVKDLEGLPGDLGDLPMASGGESDTREQPALRDEDALLSATGVTKVLHGGDDDEDAMTGKTSVLEDQDATLMAPGFDEGTSTLTGTEVLSGRLEDDESGNTSLVKQLRGGKDTRSVDLDLADLTAALHGADTVEQPRSTSFSRDVFGGGDTPLDLDIGNEGARGDEDPTGTEEVGLDPQTMTEVGTKLDLARAYIDMGDPEGARSILEEVLDEGDSNQRREAQGLIDVLSA
jgi:pilus assembly protein FimV